MRVLHQEFVHVEMDNGIKYYKTATSTLTQRLPLLTRDCNLIARGLSSSICLPENGNDSMLNQGRLECGLKWF
jgi:hypothetical protein